MDFFKLLPLTGISFVFLSLVFIPMEKVFPAKPGQKIFRRQWGLDMCYFLGQYLLWNGLVLMAIRHFAGSVDGIMPAGVRAAIQSQPFVLQCIEVIVFSDMLIYWGHRLQHNVDFLWRFHKVHHSAPHLDWLAAHREHPLDSIYTITLINLPAFIMGFNLNVLGALVAFRGIWAIYIHSNVRLNIGFLKYIIGSPEMHHWHHDLERDRGNYANISPLMDVIFGTHYSPGHEPEATGIKEDFPEHYIGQLVHPLLPKRLIKKLPKPGLKKAANLFCLSSVFYAGAQTPQQLKDSIITKNRFESEYIGAGGVTSLQYSRFEKITKLLSKQETEALTNDKNGVLRMYASTYLIEKKGADPVPLFLKELERNERIETMDGCIVSEDYTPGIIYRSYRNKIWLETMEGFSYDNGTNVESTVSEKLKTDATMRSLDSIIVSADFGVDWLLYVHAFENNNFSETLLPTIEKLGFEKHNPYAIRYLASNHPEQYAEKANEFYRNTFPKMKFDNDDGNTLPYFYEFIELMLETGNKEIQDIAVQTFRKSHYTDETWITNTFKKHGIKL